MIEKYMKIMKDNVAKRISNRFRIPYEEAYSEGLVVIAENKDKYDLIKDESLLRKKMWGHLRENMCVRRTLEIKVPTNDGSALRKKRVWFYPDSHYIDPNDIEDIVEDIDETELLKNLFFKHIDEFGLDEDEILFIDMCFSGLDPEDDFHREHFEEAFPDKKVSYLKKGFMDALTQKIKTNSPFIRG
jgi:hypothetical protein